MEKLLQLAGGVSDYKILNEFIKTPAAIKEIVYNPQWNNVVAITDHNVYRSTNGMNGGNWQNVFSTNGVRSFKKIIYINDTNWQNIPGAEDKSGYFIIGENGYFYHSPDGASLNGTGWFYNIATGMDLTTVAFDQKTSALFIGTANGNIIKTTTMSELYMGSFMEVAPISPGEDIVQILINNNQYDLKPTALAITSTGNIFSAYSNNPIDPSFGTASSWLYYTKTNSGLRGKTNYLGVFNRHMNTFLIPDYDPTEPGNGTKFLKIDAGLVYQPTQVDAIPFLHTYSVTMLFDTKDAALLTEVSDGYAYTDNINLNYVYRTSHFDIMNWNPEGFIFNGMESNTKRGFTAICSLSNGVWHTGTNLGDLISYFGTNSVLFADNKVGENYFKYANDLIVVPGTEPQLWIPMANNLFKRFVKSEGWKTFGKMDPTVGMYSYVWFNGYFIRKNSYNISYSNDLVNWTNVDIIPNNTSALCLGIKVLNNTLIVMFDSLTMWYYSTNITSWTAGLSVTALLKQTIGIVTDIDYSPVDGKYMACTKNSRIIVLSSLSSMSSIKVLTSSISSDFTKFISHATNGFIVICENNKVWTVTISGGSTYIRTLGYNVLKITNFGTAMAFGANPNIYYVTNLTGSGWSTKMPTNLPGIWGGYKNHVKFNNEDVVLLVDGSISSGTI